MPNPDTKTLKAEVAHRFRVFKSVEWNSEFEVRVHCAFLQDNGESACTLDDQAKLKCNTVEIKDENSVFPMACDLGLQHQSSASDGKWGLREYVVNVNFTQDLYLLDKLVYNIAEDASSPEYCEEHGVLDLKNCRVAKVVFTPNSSRIIVNMQGQRIKRNANANTMVPGQLTENDVLRAPIILNHIFDVASRTKVGPFLRGWNILSDNLAHLSFSRDDKRLATVASNKVSLWKKSKI